MIEAENAVLKRWDRGQTSLKIGKDLNIRPSYVRVIVQRARAKGDARAHKRPEGRPKGMRLLLTRDVQVKLADEADRRDMSERELATQLVALALSANLVGAILDDGEDA